MKIVSHCAVWILAFCAVLVGPVILIFGVPVAIGVGIDIVRAGGGPIAAVAIASAVAVLGLRKTLVRGIKTLFHWPRRVTR